MSHFWKYNLIHVLQYHSFPTTRWSCNSFMESPCYIPSPCHWLVFTINVSICKSMSASDRYFHAYMVKLILQWLTLTHNLTTHFKWSCKLKSAFCESSTKIYDNSLIPMKAELSSFDIISIKDLNLVNDWKSFHNWL